MCCSLFTVITYNIKVSKGSKIRNRYNQVPRLTQDTNGKVTNSQLDTTNETQEVNPFPAGDHKAQINRRVQHFLFLNDEFASKYTPQQKFSTDFNMMHHFE